MKKGESIKSIFENNGNWDSKNKGIMINFYRRET